MTQWFIDDKAHPLVTIGRNSIRFNPQAYSLVASPEVYLGIEGDRLIVATSTDDSGASTPIKLQEYKHPASGASIRLRKAISWIREQGFVEGEYVARQEEGRLIINKADRLRDNPYKGRGPRRGASTKKKTDAA